MVPRCRRPRVPAKATASRSALTWAGLAITIGSADDRGTCQAMVSSGLSGSSPASAA
jgi:hypothetical protein